MDKNTFSSKPAEFYSKYNGELPAFWQVIANSSEYKSQSNLILIFEEHC